MRVLVANWSQRLAGGAEMYLARVLSGLASSGVEIGLLHERDGPDHLPAFSLPTGAPRWSLARHGHREVLEAAGAWKPHVSWVHGIDDVRIEEGLLSLAPAVLFAHDYHGTCISGTKTTWLPRPTPCRRRFGAACLMRYYPLRCGGLNPATMVRLYRLQARRLAVIRRYRVITTLSQHMREEYVRHGVPGGVVFCLPPLCTLTAGQPRPGALQGAVLEQMPPSRLLFLGRMTAWKGGTLLLDALPAVRRELGRPLVATFAGDGPERERWEAQAARLPDHAGIDVRFIGWVAPAERGRLFAGHDALVMPSLWPEPFGLGGLEAAAHGLPSVAFRVGGVPEWLEDGVTGCLAPGDPPTSTGLASAIVRCLRSAGELAALGRRAAARASRASLEAHLDALVGVLDTAQQAGGGAAP